MWLQAVVVLRLLVVLLHCAFDKDYRRLDLGASLHEPVYLPTEAVVLLKIILRRLAVLALSSRPEER